MLLCLTPALRAAEAKPPLPFSVREGVWPGRPTWKTWDVTVDLAKAKLRIAAAKSGGGFLDALLPEGALAAINGGYFAADYRPTGWVRDASGELAKKNTKTRRGGLFAVKGQKAYIGTMQGLPFKAEFAVQNGPLLIEADGQRGIRTDDGKRAPRTVACLEGKAGVKKRPLHFIVVQAPPGDGPTLMETAEQIARSPADGGFGCGTALNLDGGPSTGIWFAAAAAATSSPPPVPIGYGIAIVK